jgi:hypothetical protein
MGARISYGPNLVPCASKSLLLNDPAAAKNRVALVKRRRLAWGNRPLRRYKLNLDAGIG